MKPAEIIAAAIEIAGLVGYNGEFSELGFGEVNQSYKFRIDTGECVIRITKRKGRETLLKEGRALGLLQQIAVGRIPQLIFFDPSKLIDGRMWIIESYLTGSTVARLNTAQFYSLGQLLAEAHQIKNGEAGLDLWQHFLTSCRFFGDETSLLAHMDPILRELINASKNYFLASQHLVNDLPLALIHGDATPSNVLVGGDEVRLIDWEFASFSDPLREFSTIYYDDIEYNCGKWRVKIAPKEKAALFEGYQAAGGVIDEARINFWMNFDKLGAAVFLYWKIHQSGETVSRQYQLDLGNLIKSLQNNLPNL